MTAKYPQYKLLELTELPNMSQEPLESGVFKVFYQVQVRRWETGLVPKHDGTGPLYCDTPDGRRTTVGGPGPWMNCMDSNGPLLYSSRDEAMRKIKELKKSRGV